MIKKALKRHITVTGFIVNKSSTLLHWHNKVKEWLPPGGHIVTNEDPVEALNREIYEETGLKIDIIKTNKLLPISNLKQIVPPFAFMIEDINDLKEGPHQHIDMIYFTKLKEPKNHSDFYFKNKWIWITKEQLKNKIKIANESGKKSHPPEDVIKLGLKAIEFYNK